jgi:hypothetical protein
MVEVFRTNVNNPGQARKLIEYIHRVFPTYRANFDLADCDKILRVQSQAEVNADGLINVVYRFGFKAEILPDELNTTDVVPKRLDTQNVLSMYG